jgi:hypothetical protein
VREISEEIFIDTEKAERMEKFRNNNLFDFYFSPKRHTSMSFHYIHCIVISAIYAPKKSVYIPETTQLFWHCERSGLFTFDAFCYKNNNNIKVCFCMRVFRYYFLCDFYCLVYELVLRSCVCRNQNPGKESKML